MKDFASIEAFIAHMAMVEQAVIRHAHAGLEKSAQVVEKAAKAELGYYQPAVGPFPAWDPLAESTLEHHAALGVGDSPLLVTGQLYASIEHETQGHEAVIGTKMDIGAYQEFGTDRIPPRPFMGPAVVHSKEKIEKIMSRGLVTAIVGGASVFGMGD